MGATSLLTTSWIDWALSVVGDRSFGDADLVVQYVVYDEEARPRGCDEVVHHQRFVGGRLVQWQLGPAADAELCLRQPFEAHLNMLARVELGDALLGATEVVDLVTGETGWAPPLDEVKVAWGRDLPLVPTVEPFTVQQVLIGSPFGDVQMSARIDKGRVVAAELGPTPGADVVIARLYESAVLERLGGLDVLESVEGGQVAGDVHKVATFLGLYESDEWAASRQALNGPWCRPLGVLARVLSSPAWADVARRLAATSSDVWSVP
jgi:hypothetical protein